MIITQLHKLYERPVVVIGSEKFQIPIADPSNATVGLLKQLLHEKTGIAQEAQKLIFKGKLI